MAGDSLDAKAQALIARCRCIDWGRPQHDPHRAASAYRQWLAVLGMKRRMVWVADPADVPEWRVQAAGMLNAWGALAATSPAACQAAAWQPALPAEMAIAANWASAVNLHVATVEGSSDLWFGAWRELAAREPALAHATLLLSPPFQWPVPAPAAIALAASAALEACKDARVRAGFAAAVAGARLEPGDLIEALMLLAEPMIAACEAGAFAHALRGGEILVLAAPQIWTEGGRLHRADGPAIAWPRTRAGAWRGFLLPEGFVTAPDMITPAVIGAVTGPLRQALLDICAHAGDRDVRGNADDAVAPEGCADRRWWQPPGYRAPSSEFRMARTKAGVPAGSTGCNKR